jgi:hypothetical protein
VRRFTFRRRYRPVAYGLLPVWRMLTVPPWCEQLRFAFTKVVDPLVTVRE